MVEGPPPVLAGGGPDRRLRGRRPGPRPRPAHRPPRRQAGEHHRHAGSRPHPRRLRARPRRGGRGRFRTRHHLRYPGVYGARAGSRRGTPDRRSHRHPQPGRGALRDALRPPAVPCDQHSRIAQAGARRRTAASATAPSRDPARVGKGLPEIAREARSRPLHHRGRLRRRPSARVRCHRCAERLDMVRTRIGSRADGSHPRARVDRVSEIIVDTDLLKLPRPRCRAKAGDRPGLRLRPVRVRGISGESRRGGPGQGDAGFPEGLRTGRSPVRRNGRTV